MACPQFISVLFYIETLLSFILMVNNNSFRAFMKSHWKIYLERKFYVPLWHYNIQCLVSFLSLPSTERKIFQCIQEWERESEKRERGKNKQHEIQILKLLDCIVLYCVVLKRYWNIKHLCICTQMSFEKVVRIKHPLSCATLILDICLYFKYSSFAYMLIQILPGNRPL